MGARVIWESGRDFVSHSQGGVNLVTWKNKDIFCILISNLTEDKLLVLAQKISNFVPSLLILTGFSSDMRYERR